VGVFNDISLRNPWWLLLALLPLLFWLLAALRRRLQQDAFAEASLLPWVVSPRGWRGSAQPLRQLAVVLAWCAFALAMAGPRTPQRIFDTGEAHYLNLQVVVDESYSMSARDITPTRLQRVQLELQDLVDRLQQVRMGLIVYAAHAHVMLPATADKSVLRHAIADLQVRQLPTEGSDMFEALRLARVQLGESAAQPRAILLISDGELETDSAQAQQRVLALVTSLRVDTLGVGTAHGAALLNDQRGWLQQAGQAVVTRLQATRLQTLAQAGNGRYAEIADDDSEWRSVYDEGIARLRALPAEEAATQQVIWRDLSPWFVLPGGLCLLLAYAKLPSLRQSARLVCLLGVISLGGIVHAPLARAADSDYPAAYALYHAGKYQEAARDFARLPGYAARMGEGDSLYQLQQYAQAASVYIQAVLDADTDQQRAAALFNLGNSYFKQRAYTQAVSSYRDVLRYRPEFGAAQINLAYAQALQETEFSQTGSQRGRTGNGPGTGSVPAGTEVGNARLSLDTSESQTPRQLPLAIDSAVRPGTDTGLLEQARPATQKVDRDADVSWTYDIQQASAIPLTAIRFHVDERVLWQRLYESEEDFPAPLERPEVLPGVAPW
jgi:Ca-activated chloride channel family protein